ncbi:MAG: queuosine precursor transporter [Cytophagaceae bacterium]|nr:queuosine precursor transporter [Cytophagaceae bacterium]
MKSHSLDKKTFLFIILSGIFFTNAIIAEIIGVKIITLEEMIGLTSLSVEISKDFILGFDKMTAGVIIWPIVFITTDIINEYFGKEGVKKISYLACVFIAYIFLVIWIATKLPAAAFWEKNNENFVSIFSIGLNIITGSIVAFLISQLLDAYVFHYIRSITGSKKIWLRATGSTLISQLFDSFIVIFVAFYLLESKDPWPISRVLSVALSNYIYKFLIAILLTPLLYLVHHWIDSYLGKQSEDLQRLAKNQ